MRSTVAALLFGLAVSGLLYAPAAGAASDIDQQPGGAVILTVGGVIERGGADGRILFDYDKLAAMGLRQVKTTTPWTEGVVEFEGVPADELLRRVGGHGDNVIAVALNDYKAKIPIADFSDHDVLLAVKMDGKRLRIRDKGPIWIVYYPAQTADHARLDIRSRMVWQLKELHVE